MNGYGSRKFIVTIVGMTLTFILAYAGKMSGDASLVMIAAIGGYHLANAYIAGKGNGK